jgi:FlaA1/EpsC-like NDP-sugar epimerase
LNDIETLAARVTGRDVPLFEADLERADAALHERLAGRRVLVIGGAGSIGGATVRALCAYDAASLHVLDQNENGLAELTRDIRSSGTEAPRDFRLLPLDFGGTTTERLLRDAPAYDVVFNFAAIKHVRSEKDVYSLLQLLETNVVKQARLLRWLSNGRAPGHYFSVSTDKAANPVSFMGASKRAMEHVMFSRELAELPGTVIGSARFANVAFSAGSLLESFTVRLAKRQPIAAPADTKRYFISMREAAQICLLAVACAPDAHILVPRLDAAPISSRCSGSPSCSSSSTASRRSYSRTRPRRAPRRLARAAAATRSS